MPKRALITSSANVVSSIQLQTVSKHQIDITAKVPVLQRTHTIATTIAAILLAYVLYCHGTRCMQYK